jgi:hypothetical protein
VKHFGLIFKPLTELLKKHSIVAWTPMHVKAFAVLKQALVQASVLALSDLSKQF